jgi:hypothetical protein
MEPMCQELPLSLSSPRGLALWSATLTAPTDKRPWNHVAREAIIRILAISLWAISHRMRYK